MSRRNPKPSPVVVHRETIRELLESMKNEILSTMEERIQLAVARGRKEDRETYEAANELEHAGFASDLAALRSRVDALERPHALVPGERNTAPAPAPAAPVDATPPPAQGETTST